MVSRPQPRMNRRPRGLVLPLVLVFALVLALLLGAALEGSLLETRGVAFRSEAMRARNLAETALELLVRRTLVRWDAGGEHCAVDSYCSADFPAVAAVLARAEPAWTARALLRPAAVRAPSLAAQATASSARSYVQHHLEAVVTIDGPAPVSLAAGLVLPVARAPGGRP